MSDEQEHQQVQDEANERLRRRQAEEYKQLQNPVVRAQRELDFFWQQKLDAEAALREAAEWDDSTGFLERRRPSCHRSRKDPDWYLR